MLEVSDLHAGYDNTPVLRGVTLSARDGAITALLGRNGMGKTTTIRSIVGLVKATSGSIRFDGRELCGMPIHKRAQLGIGFVPEARQVFPSLSVTEHLKIAARNGKGGRNAWPIDRLVELFPVLGRRSSARGSQLSGGEQQLLVIARALTTNPSLLLLDEPTEGLAPSIVDEIGAMIKRLCREPDAPAIVLVEQNLTFALSIADQATVLVKGEVAFDGTAEELASDPELQRALIGLGTP
ncbi:MAG: ABC transporter ATP-binding protein [Microthrixaceae bacterium]|nr:ABC transporter ATP-binding protein [Microthrixaceae bacterium]